MTKKLKPKLKSTIKQIINNEEDFDLVQIFEDTGVIDQAQGEKLFRSVIEDLIKERRNTMCKRWAKAIKGEGYRCLQTRSLDTFWKNLSIQRASSQRLKRFYDDEVEALKESKRSKIDESEDHKTKEAKRETKETKRQIKETKKNEEEESKKDSDSGATWDSFVDTHDFSSSHNLRLERHGIIQCGVGIELAGDIPESLYEALELEKEKDPFPYQSFSTYLSAIIQSKDYGLPGCAQLIFNKDSIGQVINDTAFTFISRLLYQFSEVIQNKTHPTQIKDSETSYCHEAVWPFLRCAAHSVESLSCDFKVGETKLKAFDTKNKNKSYNADGIVYDRVKELELLLLEASGPLGTRNRHRHVFDHVKAAFGCYSMVAKILSKYPRAKESLIEKAKVLFVHTSAKDDKIRLWVMKPQNMGRILSFERVKTCTIPLAHDPSKLKDVIDFFWLLKELLSEIVDGLKELERSNEEAIFNDIVYNRDGKTLVDLLTADPSKPDKTLTTTGLADLDPVSTTLRLCPSPSS